MSTYDSNLRTEFCQTKANTRCQSHGIHEQLDIKCRDPRCSLVCRNNWADKQSAVLTRFFEHHFPIGHRVYCGDLKMPNGATEPEHKAARKSFLRHVKDWQKATGWVLAIRCYSHPTAVDNLHYDFVAYTDSPLSDRTLGEQVGDLWKRSGGLRYSFSPTKNLTGLLHYVPKDTEEYDQRQTTIYLLRRGGLTITWGTRGFYQDTTEAKLWKECQKEWFGDRPRPPRKTSKQVWEEQLTAHKMWKELEEWARQQVDQDVSALLAVLPKLDHAKEPPDQHAMDKCQLLERLGWDGDRFDKCVEVLKPRGLRHKGRLSFVAPYQEDTAIYWMSSV